MEASSMMGMEQMRPAMPLNAMQQQTPQSMMQYNGLLLVILIKP